MNTFPNTRKKCVYVRLERLDFKSPKIEVSGVGALCIVDPFVATNAMIQFGSGPSEVGGVFK